MPLFSENSKVPIIFDRATLRRDKDNNRTAKLRFALPLTPAVVLLSPPEIRTAYEAIDTRDNKISEITLTPIIGGVSIEFFPLSTTKALSLSLSSVELCDLVVELNPKRGDDPCLLFTVNVPIDDKKALRHWIVDSIFEQMWAAFEMAQMVLAPSIEDQHLRQAVN